MHQSTTATNLCTAVELVMKDEALRDSQIRSIHEMGELKRAQELRVDERILCIEIERQSYDTEAHFKNTGVARGGEFKM